ncbi:MAG: hypothetical protein WCP22_05760, partial [Chlamydiota bacterium]
MPRPARSQGSGEPGKSSKEHHPRGPTGERKGRGPGYRSRPEGFRRDDRRPRRRDEAGGARPERGPGEAPKKHYPRGQAGERKGGGPGYRPRPEGFRRDDRWPRRVDEAGGARPERGPGKASKEHHPRGQAGERKGGGPGYRSRPEGFRRDDRRPRRGDEAGGARPERGPGKASKEYHPRGQAGERKGGGPGYRS